MASQGKPFHYVQLVVNLPIPNQEMKLVDHLWTTGITNSIFVVIECYNTAALQIEYKPAAAALQSQYKPAAAALLSE